MGLVSSVSENLEQEYNNNITQDSQQFCIASTDIVSGPTVVIVNGASIDGDFTGIETSVSTDASCLMVSAMEDNIDSILEATAQQTDLSETDIFSAFESTLVTRDKATVQQTMTNNILQINQAVCQASTSISTTGQYVYVTDADVGGNFIGVSTETDSSANCIMNNMMKNVTYNQASGTNVQDVTDEEMFATLFNSIGSILVAIVIILILGGIIIIIAGAVAGRSKKGKEETGGQIVIPIE